MYVQGSQGMINQYKRKRTQTAKMWPRKKLTIQFREQNMTQ